MLVVGMDASPRMLRRCAEIAQALERIVVPASGN